LFYVGSSNHNVGCQVARTGFSDQKLLVRPERLLAARRRSASAALRPALRASNFARGEVVELDLFYVGSSNHNVGCQVARTGFADQMSLPTHRLHIVPDT
jgi:hypothetical protein